MSEVAFYAVSGMTCDHCVAAVREELGALAGVQSVDVDLGSGEVRVISAGVLDDAEVRAAVVEAGYELLGADS